MFGFIKEIFKELNKTDKERFIENFDYQMEKSKIHDGVRSIEITGPLTKNSKYIGTIATINMHHTSEEAAKSLVWDTISQHKHWEITLIFKYNNGNTIRKEGKLFFYTKDNHSPY